VHLWGVDMVQLIVILVFVVGAGAAVTGVLHKYNSAVEGRVAAEKDLKTCQTDKDTLNGQIETQNKAVEALQKAGDVARRRAAAALAQAAKAEASAKAEQERLEGLKTGALTCSEAVAEIRKGLTK